jgi:predicted GNAT superfamily acetyltransferase
MSATPSVARAATDEVRARAWAASDRAAAAAGIAVREVHDLADLVAVRRLFDTIWSADPTNPAATVELLRAYTHTGQYVVIADDLTRPGRPPVAASMGFLAAPAGQALHSNVTGVLPSGRGRSLGFALKVHQRAWALERGLSEITWTFDPLIRRNAWFNLAKLGAGVIEYLENFYGSMADGLNAGDESDRLYLTWQLTEPRVAAAAEGTGCPVDLGSLRAAGAQTVLTVGPDGGPVRASSASSKAQVILAQIPEDIEGLRRSDPAIARAWRTALREVLGGALADGGRVTGIGRDGVYVVEKENR